MSDAAGDLLSASSPGPVGEKRARAALTLRVDPALHERLATEAQARGLNVNFLAERLLSEALDDLIPADEFRLTRRPTDGC